MAYYDLEKVRGIVKESTGLNIMYAYDDLVFPEHAAFIIQYDKEDENHLHCYFHMDCIPEEKDKIFSDLTQSCFKTMTTIQNSGIFEMAQKGGEVEIKFI
ncbi:hypothetical protein ACE01N_15880 [Saccharicrinis sp. FJH2]|uniref:hypothetical protein n=1 Tax=Saccharicrinis sp. FJH65 TaxID=3344659 RepID=UPI0035F40D34